MWRYTLQIYRNSRINKKYTKLKTSTENTELLPNFEQNIAGLNIKSKHIYDTNTNENKLKDLMEK
jgi:hypothetical protein